jgi:hypothetical protein
MGRAVCKLGSKTPPPHFSSRPKSELKATAAADCESGFHPLTTRICHVASVGTSRPTSLVCGAPAIPTVGRGLLLRIKSFRSSRPTPAIYANTWRVLLSPLLTSARGRWCACTTAYQRNRGRTRTTASLRECHALRRCAPPPTCRCRRCNPRGPDRWDASPVGRMVSGIPPAPNRQHLGLLLGEARAIFTARASGCPLILR